MLNEICDHYDAQEIGNPYCICRNNVFFSMANQLLVFILGSPGSITDADVLALLNYTDLLINSREELYTLNYRKQSSKSDCLAVGDFLPLIALCPKLRKYLWIFLGPHPTDLPTRGFLAAVTCYPFTSQVFKHL